MMNKLKQARKLLLSFGMECKDGYCNTRYINSNSYWNSDRWLYIPQKGQFQMFLNHERGNCTYTEYIPSILSNNQAKLSKLVKDLKRLKKLWFDTMDESFKLKFIRTVKAEESLQDDFK